MSGQAQIRSGLQIVSGAVNYNPLPNAFNATVVGANGPTPGAILVATEPGTDVNLSELTKFGGFCRILNLDPTNYVTVGVESGGVFYPFMEMLPGEFYFFRMSRKIQQDYPGTGTAQGSTTMRIVAKVAACRVLVDCFDP